MPRPPKPPAALRAVAALTHADSRRNIPTAEFQSLNQHQEEKRPIAPVRYPRASPLAPGETRVRNPDLDPQLVWRGMRIRLTDAQRQQLQDTGEVELGDAQLVWRGKDTQDWSDLVVNPPPIYIQEKLHPKAIIDDLMRQSRVRSAAAEAAPDLFADFNGLLDPEAKLEFYQHDQHWSNRFILGDSLQVMASLAEREGLRGKVQCIYFDPPYGIKFNSNWQVSTQSRDVKDGRREDVSREPEQVKAFRDTWKDGIHSYLTYLRDRLTVARELLTESGSIFVQIGDENVHRVRAVMDEVFGASNFISEISFKKTTGLTSGYIASNFDTILWYSQEYGKMKFRSLVVDKGWESDLGFYKYVQDDAGVFERTIGDLKDPSVLLTKHLYSVSDLTSSHDYSLGKAQFNFRGRNFSPARRFWTTSPDGMKRLQRASRIHESLNTVRYVRKLSDNPYQLITSNWSDTLTGQYSDERMYVVQTANKVIQRCILMATDPGDLVLDPTCGSGTTATVAEQWGRRWITIDTSRVALSLARTRLMAAKYPYYLLADSREGRIRETAVSGKVQGGTPTQNDVRHGFVYERAPHVTLKSIANNAEIDVLWDEAQLELEADRVGLNTVLETSWEEWQVPRKANPAWPVRAHLHHAAWWAARIERQRRIDASIARKADIEVLYDRPYEDSKRTRVAGPFTVESLSPHRVVPADEDDLSLAPDLSARRRRDATPPVDFAAMVLDHLRTAGVHQTQKKDSITFTSLTPWPGDHIGAEGRYMEGSPGEDQTERRAGILIGPEFGTLARTDLTAAAREASDARFDVLIACAFNYDAHAAELTKLGPMPILKARMNPDLHMADDLKNTGRGNLFVVFGEPDLKVEPVPGKPDHVQVRILGVDVFDPQSGDIRSSDTDSIATWFIDTDYDNESFFVRHAYFLGANDPYKSLKAALRAEIDEAAWATLYRDVSRPFPRPQPGRRVAVKVINHFGDEVMKVFSV